jgi:ubiquinone/menaquinone biosynthesis C-methylase UbiE
VAEPSPFDLTVAAYDATADVYAQWIGTEISSAIEAPLDRAMLEAFAEQIASAAPGQIADIGCGTGRATAYLDRRGLRVVGIDPSAGMLAVARTAHPRLDFRLGALAELPLRDAEVVGAVCWYSIIHTAADDLPPALGELARVIAPGGQLLLAFQSGGGEAVQRTSVQGRTVSLTNHRHDPDVVAECLGGAGFHVHTRAVRDAVGAHESTPQAFLMAERLPDLAA